MQGDTSLRPLDIILFEVETMGRDLHFRHLRQQTWSYALYQTPDGKQGKHFEENQKGRHGVFEVGFWKGYVPVNR